MLKVVLYIAASLDGFIADESGGVDWLEKYSAFGEDFRYSLFYDSIDALAFGKNTYNQVLGFGDWPYPDKKSYIFGDEDMHINQKNVQLVLEDIPTFLRTIEKDGIQRLWLMGGAQLVDSFYRLNMIDEYIIAYMPEKLGHGIALPTSIYNAERLVLVDTIAYPKSGVIQKYYIHG